ncbi:MAG: hypothetical protein CEO22_153 [Candidatus Berkelbacteria bacterium Gr01-1014_85]|uniref:Uncharacterized protein n=1 Tax=Candidatus Berkelbacteria bacterium Gr01-1014_85 TaxID=2017150 RepID=A0A554JD54_9BACT|nr:MAG: hypothetical protein CEO22_153 [Candidatus Berkelbacteria bacterium Gr01-1014_85]
MLLGISLVYALPLTFPYTEIRLLTLDETKSISFGRQYDAQWKRVGPGILRFQGNWNGDEASTDQLRKLLNEPVELVRIVKSGGGVTDEAIANAELLLPFKPRIVVEDLCASSCANYLLPIASEINVRPQAVIGYHGTICEVLANDDSCEREQAFWDKLPNGDRISQLPVGLRLIELPPIGQGWMPTKQDFIDYGYPPITFDWYPEPYKKTAYGVYVAPVPLEARINIKLNND